MTQHIWDAADGKLLYMVLIQSFVILCCVICYLHRVYSYITYLSNLTVIQMIRKVKIKHQTTLTKKVII